MVKIIRGVYGYVTDNGVVEPKTVNDAPFSLSVEEEARLVNQGVAEYVDEPKKAEPKKAEAKAEPKAESKKPAKKTAKKSNKKATKTDDAPPRLEAQDPE